MSIVYSVVGICLMYRGCCVRMVCNVYDYIWCVSIWCLYAMSILSHVSSALKNVSSALKSGKTRCPRLYTYRHMSMVVSYENPMLWEGVVRILLRAELLKLFSSARSEF